MPDLLSGLRRASLLAASVLVFGCSHPGTLSPPGHRAHEVSLVVADQQLVAAWHGGLQGDAIWMRRTDRSGNPAGLPVRLTDGNRHAFEPDLQAFPGGFLLAWYEKNPADGSLAALVARFDAAGQRRWQRELSPAGANGRNPVIRVGGDTALVAWIESTPDSETSIWTARIDADGKFRDSPERRAPASNETWNLNAALDVSGTFHVVYDAMIDTRAKELHLLSIGADQVTYSALSADDGFDSTYPDLAISTGRVAVTWLDARDGATQIYFFAGQLEDLGPALDTHAQRVSHTPGPSIGAYLAWNGTRIGLAWCDASSGQNEIYTRFFNDQGIASKPARQLTHNSTSSLIPAIRPWRTGFAVAWNEYQPAGEERSPLHASAAMSTAMLELIP